MLSPFSVDTEPGLSETSLTTTALKLPFKSFNPSVKLFSFHQFNKFDVALCDNKSPGLPELYNSFTSLAVRPLFHIEKFEYRQTFTNQNSLDHNELKKETQESYKLDQEEWEKDNIKISNLLNNLTSKGII